MNTSKGLGLLVWSCDLDRPELLATPFMMAQAARALDMPVSMLFAARSVQWLLEANRDLPVGFGAQRITVGQFLETSAALGVQIAACSQALAATGADAGSLHPGCQGTEGMVSFVEQGQQSGWQMLVF